jgi:uncharacterized SAM-dependent methyltransferase
MCNINGPWSVHSKHSYIMDKVGVAFAQLTKSPHHYPDMMEKAVLAASAPELLEALKYAQQYIEDDKGRVPSPKHPYAASALQTIRAAIAKATGK